VSGGGSSSSVSSSSSGSSSSSDGSISLRGCYGPTCMMR